MKYCNVCRKIVANNKCRTYGAGKFICNNCLETSHNGTYTNK